MSNHPSRPRTSLKPVSLAVLLCVWGLPSLAQDNSDSSDKTSHTLDWVERRQVPEQLQDEQCLRCDGRYIDPLAGFSRDEAAEEADIHATAGSTELIGNTVTLSGGVVVQQGYRQFRSDSASLNRLERHGHLEGNIEIREPGVLLRGERAEVFSESGEASIENSQFVLHQQHLRGNASLLDRDSDGILHIHGGQLSFCAPENNDWMLRADELELNLDEGLGIARGARIDVAGVPVFYSPWLQFPLDDRRRTGLLWPDIGSDSRSGINISVPVYLNLAPNYDLLYSPQYIQERGLNHEVKARYLNPYLGSWTVGGAFMADDKRNKDEFPDQRSHDRWLGVIKHNGLFDQRWRSRVDYSRASDVNYLKDLETSSLDSKRQTALLQLGKLDYLGDKWMANVELQQFQSLADDISNDYKKLPQITGRYRPDGTPFKLDPILLAQYSSFDTDDDRVFGERLYLEAGGTYPMLWNYGFLTPTAKYRQLDYDLNSHSDYQDNSPSAGSAMASLDGGLYFDRRTRIADKDMVQTLEPRLYYLYSEYQDQTGQPDFDSAELTFSYNQLFRETRFSGRDRIDDADQVSVGITTRFIDEGDGREEFNASIGQIFYFRDRLVRLQPSDPPLETGGSEVAGELSWFPNDRLSLRSSLIYDPYEDDMNAGYFHASYRPDDRSIYNLGYSYRRPLTTVTRQVPTEQVNLSSYFPVGQNWALFAGWNYSLEANTSVEDMVGVEYDTCCWKIRLLHLRYYDNSGQGTDFDDPDLQREHSTQVQIVLKGMGGFGSKATGIMKDMIRGFTDSEY